MVVVTSAMAKSAKEIEWTAKRVAAVFAVLVAVGVLVKAAGGPNAVAVAFGGVGVVGALAAFVLLLLQHRAERREEQESLWRRGIGPSLVREVAAGDDIYGLGVETEAPEALGVVGLGHHGHAPYAPREVDTMLRGRLMAAADDDVTLVILRGASKAGKSRTMLEALRATLPDAWLMMPKDGASLARLAEGTPPSNIGSGVCAVWLDDIELFVGLPGEDGLNASTLKDLARWGRPVVLLATAGGKGGELAGSEQYAEPTRDLLRAHPPLELTPWLSSDEQKWLADLESYSDDAVRRIASEGIGEFMIAAPRIREKLAEGSRCPEGLAVIQAAVDWRRVGLLRPVSQATLRDLYVHYLPGPDLQARFEQGLVWATKPLYSRVALLLGQGEYAPYDYVVEYERQRARPITEVLWAEVIDEHAEDAELSRVGVIALEESRPDLAERAFRKGSDRGDASATFNLGVVLAKRGDFDGARRAYQQVINSGHSELMPAAARNLAVLLREREDFDGARRAYQQAIDSGDFDQAPRAALGLALMLEERGDFGARIAHQQAINSGHPDIAPKAALSLAVMLRKRGDFQGARRAYQQAIDSGHSETAPSAAYDLGVMLKDRGDFDGARQAYQAAIGSGHAEQAPKAAFNLGFMLKERGDFDCARLAYQAAIDSGHAEQAPKAAINLAVLLYERGDPDGARVAFQRAIDSGHRDFAPEAAYGLGLMLHEHGDLDGARHAYAQAADSGHPNRAARARDALDALDQ